MCLVVDEDGIAIAAGIPPIRYRPLDRCSQIDAVECRNAHPFPGLGM